MKHIRRKITVSVLGTMLFVFAVIAAVLLLIIPKAAQSIPPLAAGCDG